MTRGQKEELLRSLPSLEEEAAKFAKQSEMAQGLMAKDPKLTYISAIIIAGDMLSNERSWQWLQEGMPFERALLFVGSYGRLDFVIRAIADARVDATVVFEMLPELWRGSDPDDTDPRFLDLWTDAWNANGRETITDGRPLPKGEILTVYRGQDEVVDPAAYGIAWSLDQDIAEKFARGAATRQMNRGGTVYSALVHRKNIMGYLTGRGESEVIVNPLHLGPDINE